MDEDIKKEIIELLENLKYWETCPQSYKDRIPTMIKALTKKSKNWWTRKII